MRDAFRKGLVEEELEGEFEAAAGMCALMRAAVQEAVVRYRQWKRVTWGREDTDGVKDLARYLDTVADHGRADGRNMRHISSVVNDLNPRQRSEEDEEVEED